MDKDNIQDAIKFSLRFWSLEFIGTTMKHMKTIPYTEVCPFYLFIYPEISSSHQNKVNAYNKVSSYIHIPLVGRRICSENFRADERDYWLQTPFFTRPPPTWINKALEKIKRIFMATQEVSTRNFQWNIFIIFIQSTAYC